MIRNIVPNTERSYKNLGHAISNGRLAGLIDWDAIEDRLRKPVVPFAWRSGPRAYVEAHADVYRLDRNEGQPEYIDFDLRDEQIAAEEQHQDAIREAAAALE